MLALTFVMFFLFLFIKRAVGDFRAEFCDKPIARTPRPFGLILRLLIRRAVYCNLFLNAAKEANRTKQWAFKVWARAAKRRFVLALLYHPDPARYNTGHHRNSIQDPLQRRPEEEEIGVVCRGRFAS